MTRCVCKSAASIEKCKARNCGKTTDQKEKEQARSSREIDCSRSSLGTVNTCLTASASKEKLKGSQCNIKKCKRSSHTPRPSKPSVSNDTTCVSLGCNSKESFPSRKSSNTSNKSWFCKTKKKAPIVDQQDAIDCCSNKKQKKKKCKQCCQFKQHEIASSCSPPPPYQALLLGPPIIQDQLPYETSSSYNTAQTCQKQPEKQCIRSGSPSFTHTRNQDATESRNACAKVTISTTGRNTFPSQFDLDEKCGQCQLGKAVSSPQDQFFSCGAPLPEFMSGRTLPVQFDSGQMLQGKFTSDVSNLKGLISQGVQTQLSHFSPREQVLQSHASATKNPPCLFSQSTQTPSSFASYPQGQFVPRGQFPQGQIMSEGHIPQCQFVSGGMFSQNQFTPGGHFFPQGQFAIGGHFPQRQYNPVGQIPQSRLCTHGLLDPIRQLPQSHFASEGQFPQSQFVPRGQFPQFNTEGHIPQNQLALRGPFPQIQLHSVGQFPQGQMDPLGTEGQFPQGQMDPLSIEGQFLQSQMDPFATEGQFPQSQLHSAGQFPQGQMDPFGTEREFPQGQMEPFPTGGQFPQSQSSARGQIPVCPICSSTLTSPMPEYLR